MILPLVRRLFISALFLNPASSIIAASAAAPPGTSLSISKLIIFHRHGDRTPITPLTDSSFWSSTLPSALELEGISKGTTIVKNSSAIHLPPSLRDLPPVQHGAGANPPFGLLTSLGLLQTISLGTTLRTEILSSFPSLSPDSFSPRDLHVLSTDFSRTIASVRGVLTGLFPDPPAPSSPPITIDTSYTNILIPDPQPRNTQRQLDLESSLLSLVAAKDAEKLELATRVSDALRDGGIVDSQADRISYGVGEEKDDASQDGRGASPLAFSQLAEVTKCLRVRDLLPPTISAADQEELMAYAAERWTTLLSAGTPSVSTLAMSPCLRMLLSFAADPSHPKATLISAHDSTLIGLLCALKLRMPAVWPEYAQSNPNHNTSQPQALTPSFHLARTQVRLLPQAGGVRRRCRRRAALPLLP